MDNQINIEKIYRLTPMQKGMLFHYLKNDSAFEYFEQLILNIQGDFSPELTERSINLVIKKHDVLRTIFAYKKLNEPRQVVLKNREIKVNFEDVSDLALNEVNKFIYEYKKNDRLRGFNLSKDCLIRVSVIKVGQSEFKLIISFHHIILDGWSIGIVLKDFFEIYKSVLNKESIKSGNLNQFSEYISWLNERNTESALDFWKQYLDGYENTTYVPGKTIYNKSKSQEKIEYTFTIDKNEWGTITSCARNNKVTTNNLVQAIIGVILSRYNNIDDVVFGSLISGRNSDIKEIEKFVGLFINTIPIRVKINEEGEFFDVVRNIQNNYSNCEKNGYLPLSLIQASSIPKENLINCLIGFENYPMEKEVESILCGETDIGFTVKGIEIFEQTNYDFNVIFIPGTNLKVKVSYNPEIYDEDLIKNFEIHFKNIMNQVVTSKNILINDIEILSELEKKKVVHTFNSTDHNYAKDKTIYELFEQQVKKCISKKAVVYENTSLTYKELYDKSSKLACTLRENGIVPGDIVGLLADRSIEIIIGILGILKLGAVYLPLDIKYPINRLKYMIEDSDAKIVLTQENLKSDLDFGVPKLLLNKENFEGLYEDFKGKYTSEDLAYIIYTSGSTGQPKGVMLKHKGISSLKTFFEENLNITYSDNVLQFASISFDASVWEIFMALLTGATLFIPSNEVINNYSKFEDFLIENNISIATLPPTYLNNIDHKMNYGLKKLITAGSSIYKELFERWKGKVDYINAYGPTETTICATVWKCKDFEQEFNNVPIGKPINNLKVLILDKKNRLMPEGMPGQICVLGDGLAKGYLNKPELTAEKFILSPVYPQQTIYLTGDLGRWLPDGNVEFLGRIDHQVKIRGFRIELGEIENCLLKLSAIKEVKVIAVEDINNQKSISAYYVAQLSISKNEFEEFILQFLPEYMMPSKFIKVDTIPLTVNGKVDEKSLVSLYKDTELREFIEPKSEIETKLAKLWKDILNVERIGLYDSFFEIGGDSLSAIRVLTNSFSNSWNLTMQDLYKYKTLKELSERIAECQKEVKISTEPIGNTINDNLITYASYKKDKEVTKIKEYNNILLTGVTGFLGAHILKQLMTDIMVNVYCLIRGNSKKEIEDRLRYVLEQYFDDKYLDEISNRIYLIAGDITDDELGMGTEIYSNIGAKLDMIIHCAAIVKHYGDNNSFEDTNILGTKNILKLAEDYSIKTVYISTTSVCGYKVPGKDSDVNFTENDVFIGQDFNENIYIKSKLEAEKLVLNSLKKGTDAYIFRVGNLTGRYNDGAFQININDNNFYNLLKAITFLGIIADDTISMKLEFTPVDYCSKAIVLLSMQQDNSTHIYHLFNDKMILMKDLLGIIEKTSMKALKFLSSEDFLSYLIGISSDKDLKEIAATLILNLDYLGLNKNNYCNVKLSSQMTQTKLNTFGFTWPVIDNEYLNKIFDHMKKKKFIK